MALLRRGRPMQRMPGQRKARQPKRPLIQQERKRPGPAEMHGMPSRQRPERLPTGFGPAQRRPSLWVSAVEGIIGFFAMIFSPITRRIFPQQRFRVHARPGLGLKPGSLVRSLRGKSINQDIAAKRAAVQKMRSDAIRDSRLFRQDVTAVKAHQFARRGKLHGVHLQERKAA